MATSCAYAAKLALPTLRRNVFRPEFAPELHSFQRLSRHGASISYRKYRSERQFSVLSGHRNSQPGLPSSLENELSVAGDVSNPPQSQMTTESRTSGTTPETLKSKPRPKSQSKPKSGVDDFTSKRPKDFKNKAKPSQANASPETAKPRSKESSHTKQRSNTDRNRTDLKPKKKKKREPWEIQKDALREKFREGWNPTKKLSPDAVEGIRHLHAAAPDRFTTPVLAQQFEISAEAVRRILKSKWRASEPEMDDRRRRWEKRHDKIWSHMSELGLRPKTQRTKSYVEDILRDENDKNGKL